MNDQHTPEDSPLEVFLREYLESIGGAWDEVEPRVYDVLFPMESDRAEMLRLAFDPEALPEHPDAQLASFGSPLIDRILSDAVRRGRSALFYFIGQNLSPHNLEGRVRKSLSVADPLELTLKRVRALHFSQAIYWFRAEFVSDHKAQTILPMGVDLHYGREVRHLPDLLDPSRLAREPVQPLPDARRQSLSAGYAVAREQVLRSLLPVANNLAREVAERRDRQIERMTRYYADLRQELENRPSRSKDPQEAEARAQQALLAIDREEQLRGAELRQKSHLRASLCLLQLLRVEQPKLLIHTELTAPKIPPRPLELVWDPLTEALEAPPCPQCGKPSFALEASRQGACCPACAAKPATSTTRSGR